MSDVAALTAEVLRRKRAIRDTTAAQSDQLWAAVGFPDDAAERAWLADAVPLHVAALEATVALTDAYVTQWLAGSGVDPVADPLDAAAVLERFRSGVTPTDTLRRPIVEARWRLSTGQPADVALGIAAERVRSIVTTNVQQVYRVSFATRAAAEPDGAIPGYRRVLSGPENCALCVVASAQRYHSDRLLPIHPGCDCGVEPLPPGTAVVGQTIAGELPRARAARAAVERDGIPSAGGRNVILQSDELVDVTEHDHDELGPILTARRHRPRTVESTTRRRREFAPDGTLVRNS